MAALGREIKINPDLFSERKDSYLQNIDIYTQPPLWHNIKVSF